MHRPNPPPRECLLLALVDVDGDDWARAALLRHPGLLWHVRRMAQQCTDCADTLNRLFPEGVPEPADVAGDDPPQLEPILEQLRKEIRQTAEPEEDTPG